MSMMILTKEAIGYLNQELGLPATGREQDWEIELSDASRIGEFISFYENHTLSDDRQYALMALIVGSLGDLVYAEPVDEIIWGKVAKLLCANPILHKPIIDYWSQINKYSSDGFFVITELMRSLKCK